MTRKEIVEFIIRYLENEIDGLRCNLEYYFEKDEYSDSYEFNTFTLNKSKKWKFGIWVFNSEDNKNNFKVYLFAQHKWYIDKFKPSYSPIRYEFEISKREKNLDTGLKKDYSFKLFDFKYDVKNIFVSDVASRIKYYWKGAYGNAIKCLISEKWFYDVKIPIYNWYINHGMVANLYLVKTILKARFGKKIDVSITPMRELFSPKWSIQVDYNIKTKEETIKTCDEVNKMIKAFTTKLAYDYIEVIHRRGQDWWPGGCNIY